MGLFAAGAMFGFASCSSDDIQPDIQGPNGPDTDYARTFYVNLNLRTGGGEQSRAGGDPTFDRGNGESNVSDAYFVFYDQAGNVVGGDPVAVDLSNVQWTEEADANGNVDKYYQSVVGVTVTDGQDNPAQVICYLNPQTPSALSKPLSEIQSEVRANFTRKAADGKLLFSMSNSVFYENNSADAPQIAVRIAPDQLFNTRAAAEAAVGADGMTVDIYVERYAAKLTFNAAEAEPYKTISRSVTTENETDVELTFVPKTWMMNASCTETYIIKSFREEDASTGNMLADNYGYQELNNVINKNNGDWAWNNTGYHRSYWAMAPSYFTAVYPEVSSDVEDTDLYQHYSSYNELINGIGGKAPTGYKLPAGDGPVTEYVHETTVGSKALASKNILAALPSVIYVGDYIVKIGDQELTDTDFYTYGVVSANDDKAVVYFDVKEGSLTGESDVDGGESILRALIKGATNLYKKVGDNSYENFDLTNEDELTKLVAVLELADLNEEVNADIKGGLKIPERYRTLKFREGVTAAQLEGIYVGTSVGYCTIDPVSTTPAEGEITLLTANQELMKVVGFAYKYNAGAAYFNIPIKHLGWYRSSNENNKPEAEMNWSKVRVGDFGVVRNHSYNINVTSITGLGTGIGGKDNPIVPPPGENRYYIAYRVNILNWAIVPTQNVDL